MNNLSEKYLLLDFAEIRKRVKDIRGKESQDKFGSKFNMSQGDISKIENGALNPPTEFLFNISMVYDVDLRWLLTGMGSQSGMAEFTSVPKYKLRLSGGPGAYVLNQDVESSLVFKTSWLNGRCPKNHCGMFEVSGDSMSPAICHGDIVLVDMRQIDTETLVNGKIYAFSEDDYVRVKRLERRGDGVWQRSDNEVEGGKPGLVERDQFRIIGRVIWVGHEVR